MAVTNYFYLGQAYSLQEIADAKEPLSFDNGFYLLRHYQDKKDILLKQWYKQQAIKYFRQRCTALAQQFEFTYQSCHLSNAKSYWGICRHDNVIRLNWVLIKGPPEVIDYVILHELAHTKIKNHSQQFWQLVASCRPEYKSHKKQLREWTYGHA